MPRSSPTSRLLALLAGAAVLVSGCAAVGPNFKPPAPPTAAGYVQAGDEPNSGNVQAAVGQKVIAEWWTLFHSPELNDLMTQAIAASPNLQQARARLAAAHEAMLADTGQLMADGSAGYKRERANLNAFSGGAFSAIPRNGVNFPTNPEFNLYSIGGTVSYDFDLFGGVRRKHEALAADEEAQAHELEAAYLTLTGQVVNQALMISDALDQIHTRGEIVAAEQADLDIMRKAYAAGGASATDVATLETQVEQDSATLPAQHQRLARGRHMLAVLLGKSPGEWAPPDFDIRTGRAVALVLPVALPSELVRQRPDILEAEAQLHAAVARVGVATADLYPKLTLTGSLSQDALTPSQLFSPVSTSYAIGPSVTLPIFHSGELQAKKREAEDNARAALANYRITVLTAFGQVADALAALAHDNAALADQRKALATATSKLEMMRAGLKAGGVSALQVEDAQQSYWRTKLVLDLQGADTYADVARLLLSTSTVPPDLAANVPLPPKP